jgi:hypothetical protein
MAKKYDYNSNQEADAKATLLKRLKDCPLPESDVLNNLGLYLTRINVQNILLLDGLYRQILDKHGIIVEFGTRWGRNLALFSALRGMHEPFVRSRKIVGFDTFEGFIHVNEKDSKKNQKGDFNVTKGYETYLDDIMASHEKLSPISHIKKYELVKGDATVKIHEYLKDNPETIIALAYFDMNLYEPTKKCLLAIKDHMTKGGIIAFDQLNFHDHPGETIALKEVFGNKYQIRRWPLSQSVSYIVLE